MDTVYKVNTHEVNSYQIYGRETVKKQGPWGNLYRILLKTGECKWSQTSQKDNLLFAFVLKHHYVEQWCLFLTFPKFIETHEATRSFISVKEFKLFHLQFPKCYRKNRNLCPQTAVTVKLIPPNVNKCTLSLLTTQNFLIIGSVILSVYISLRQFFNKITVCFTFSVLLYAVKKPKHFYNKIVYFVVHAHKSHQVALRCTLHFFHWWGKLRGWTYVFKTA